MDRSAANPDALDSVAGPVSNVATNVRSVPPALRSYLQAAAAACGDAGLADAIHGFEARCDGAGDGLGQVVEALAEALHEVAAAFRKAGG
jgi:hypothetical protein